MIMGIDIVYQFRKIKRELSVCLNRSNIIMSQIIRIFGVSIVTIRFYHNGGIFGSHLADTFFLIRH